MPGALPIGILSVTVPSFFFGGNHLPAWLILEKYPVQQALMEFLNEAIYTDDDMMVTGKRPCFYYEYEIGHDADGRITAAKVEMCRAPASRPTGKLMTHAPSTSQIPAVPVSPRNLDVKLFKNRNSFASIHRSKAVGGHRHNPSLRAPAAREAILDAIDAVRAAANWIIRTVS